MQITSRKAETSLTTFLMRDLLQGFYAVAPVYRPIFIYIILFYYS